MKNGMTIEEFSRNCKYETVMRNFYAISQIPRESGKQKQISDFIVSFAESLNLPYEQDETLNVIVRKPACPGYESAPSVMVTAHMDMVCEKLPSIDHDFATEPLELMRLDDKVFANGTTLGADDGIGCAYLMTLLAEGVDHPELEAVFTVDEETDMKGALNLDYSKIKSKLVLNMDGRALCASAASETELHMSFPVERVPICNDQQTYCITIGGLHGGHTGADAMKERGNASLLMCRALMMLREDISYQLVSMDSGLSRASAFARDAKCIIAVSEADVKALKCLIENIQTMFQHELIGRDTIEMNVYKKSTEETQALSEKSAEKLLSFLTIIPDGVLTSDHVNKEHFLCSSNTGVVRVRHDDVFIATLIRSHLTSMQRFLFDKIKLLCEMMNISLCVDHDLPQYEYNLSEEFLKLIQRVYQGMPIDICDACIECGIFSSKIEGSTVMSLALPHFYPHSPKEHFFVDEAMLCYERLLEVLRALK